MIQMYVKNIDNYVEHIVKSSLRDQDWKFSVYRSTRNN
jgi:hypothetical protein